jgi:hypothetical protein
MCDTIYQVASTYIITCKLQVIARNAFVTTSLSDYVHHLIALRWKAAAGLNVAAGFSREPPIQSDHRQDRPRQF